MNGFQLRGIGWRPDVPDFRDYSPQTPAIQTILAPLTLDHRRKGFSNVDLREYFPDVDNQEQPTCSCAHACTGLVEYYQRRCLGQTARLAPQFVYETSRRLLGLSGSVCTELRATLKAIKLFGIPPERYWPNVDRTINGDADAFLYMFGDRYKSISYVRLDAAVDSGQNTLHIVRSFLAAGFPTAFGFSVPSSITRGADIPYRPRFDGISGGHAVVAVGYDDNRLQESRGALLIRNSWGPSWGDNGYGWLPYSYVTNRLAADFWTILNSEWIDTSEFCRPGS